MLLIKKKFLSFILSGGIAALINIISRVIISKFLAYEYAIIIAYIIGMITAYILVKNFVFINKGISNIKSIPAIVNVNFFALVQTWVASIILRNHFLPLFNINNNKDIYAHIIGVCIPIFSSYYGHKHITFRK